MYTCTHTHAHTHVCLHKHTWTHTHVFTLLLLHSCYETRFRNADCYLSTQAHTPRRLFDLKNSSQVFDQKKKKKKDSSLDREQALFFHFTRSQGQSPRSSFLLDVCGGTQMSAIF